MGYTEIGDDCLISLKAVIDITAEAEEFETQKRVWELPKYSVEKADALPVERKMFSVLWDHSGDDYEWSTEAYFYCRSCGKLLCSMHPKRSIKYCSSCGQKLKWELDDR